MQGMHLPGKCFDFRVDDFRDPQYAEMVFLQPARRDMRVYAVQLGAQQDFARRIYKIEI